MNAYKPRSYQQGCLNNLRAARRAGKKKALIVMASGLGKTLTGVFDIKQLFAAQPNGRVLVLCHSEAILSQTKEVFKRNFGECYSYGMYNGNQKAPHRTDFLFANLQSMNLHRGDFAPEEFDFIVVDEAHHSPAETYRGAIEYFRPQFLLGMTATPERMDDASLGDIFGETVFEYRLVDAVRDGWLSKVKYRVKTDELQNLGAILDSGEKFSLSRLNREIFVPKRDEEIVRVIREEVKSKENPTMVIFCQSIAHAEKFAELMGDATVIHSRMSAAERAQKLAGYRAGTIKTVCAVDILNEGIDVPRTDVIVFLRVTQSRIVFTQQLGRGLRRAKGKGEVLVLDFVSTVDRLDMLFQFRREFKSSTGRYPRNGVKEPDEYFTLEMDTPTFQEREADILALIEQAQRNAPSRQSFPDWDELSTESIWEDVIHRFVEFRGANGRMVEKTDLGKGVIPSMYFLKTYLGEEVTLTEVCERAYPDAKKVWTKEKVNAALVQIATQLGRVPSQKDLRTYAKAHKNAVPAKETLDRVGYRSYTDAYIKLGYDVDLSGRPWGMKAIVAGMRQIYDFYGRIPSMAEYSQYRKEHPDQIPCMDTVRAIDGKVVGWREAFRIRLGVEDELSLSFDEATAILSRVTKKYGKRSLSFEGYKEYRRTHPDEDLPGCCALITALGARTWNEAKYNAGLDGAFSPEQVIAILKNVAEWSSKRSLSFADYRSYQRSHPGENLPGCHLIKVVLGVTTWNEAKRKAGLPTSRT